MRIALIALAVAVLAVGGYFLFQPKNAPQNPETTSPSIPSKKEVVVYFSKSAGEKAVTEAVTRKIPAKYRKEHNNPKLSYAIESLLSGPSKEEAQYGFYSEIPKGTHLLGINEQGGDIRINLSKQFTTGGGANSVQQRLAELSQTIFSVVKDRHVYIDIEGEELHAIAGEGLEVDEPLQPKIQ